MTTVFLSLLSFISSKPNLVVSISTVLIDTILEVSIAIPFISFVATYTQSFSGSIYPLSIYHLFKNLKYILYISLGILAGWLQIIEPFIKRRVGGNCISISGCRKLNASQNLSACAGVTSLFVINSCF